MACCEFISTSTQYSINDIPNVQSFPDAILNEISNQSIKQGRLQKYVVAKTKEEWKEEYFWLDVERLWYLSLKSWETEKQLSYVDLNDSTEAKMTNLLTCTFTIYYNNNGRGAMLLKARSKDEADHWIADINNRKKLKSDNLIVAAIENIIGETESKNSHRDIDKINQISTFEGMICNSTFRKCFKRYLQQIMLVEAFRFWEQAEDFRRAHPYSSQPFQTGVNVDKKTVASKGITPAQVMKAWAKRLYTDFLAPDARHRIPYLYETVDNIREVIDSTVGCPPATVFESLQKTCFQKMKFELYPEFIKQDQYRKAFQSAIRPNPQQDNEKVSNLKVEDQNGTIWRFQILPEDSYWLPDYWWSWSKDFLTQPSVSEKGNNNSISSSSSDARPVLTKYLKLCDTLLFKEESEMLKAFDSQFKVSKIQENVEPILDEFFVPNSVRPSFAPKLLPLLRPKSVNIPGGSIGNVAMLSLMKCKYHRRSFANTKVSRSAVESISPNNKIDPRSEKVGKGKVPDLQVQSTVNEDVGRKRSLSEDYIGLSSGIEWKQHLLVLVEWLGSGRLLILDPVSHIVNAILHMNLISEVTVTDGVLNSIDIKDGNGLLWQFSPEPVNEDDGRFLTQRWLTMLSLYGNGSVSTNKFIRILHCGYLSKRGQRNNSLRRRWFVLTTDRMLRYYKDDAVKGEINLNKVATINEDKVTGDYGKSLWGKAAGTYSGDMRAIVLWTQDRLWIFQADSTEDCNRWFLILKAYVTVIAGAFSTVTPSILMKSNMTDNDSDEDSVE